MTQTMAVDFSWKPEYLYSILPVILTGFSFEIYWFTTKSEKVKSLFYSRFKFDDAAAYHITFLRIIGFLAMGLLSGLLSLFFLTDYSLSDFGLTYNPETTLFSLVWTVVLVIPIIPITFLNARTPMNLINYPQIRARLWTRKIAAMNIAGWIIYLFGYEFLFRGILLFTLAGSLGVWPAIAINIAFYSITHVPKGKRPP